jgi:hypothetical protein
MIDAEGNNLWPESITLNNVGNQKISNFSDTSFFLLQIEDWCDVIGSVLTFSEYDLSGNVIWQTTYDLMGSTNSNAPTIPDYFQFEALNNSQLVAHIISIETKILLLNLFLFRSKAGLELCAKMKVQF